MHNELDEKNMSSGEPKPNTKEYIKLHSVKQPYTVHDIGYMEQLIRYHESVATQLRKEINQLREE